MAIVPRTHQIMATLSVMAGYFPVIATPYLFGATNCSLYKFFIARSVGSADTKFTIKYEIYLMAKY